MTEATSSGSGSSTTTTGKKKPSLLVDYSKSSCKELGVVRSASAHGMSLSGMARVHAGHLRASTGSIPVPSVRSSTRTGTSSSSRRFLLGRNKSESHLKGTRKERLIKILDQATSTAQVQLPLHVPASEPVQVDATAQEGTTSSTSREEITFCVKRTSDPIMTHLGDSSAGGSTGRSSSNSNSNSNSNDLNASSDTLQASEGSQDTQGSDSTRIHIRRRHLHVQEDTTGIHTSTAMTPMMSCSATITMPKRSYHSLLDTSVHSTFLPSKNNPTRIFRSRSSRVANRSHSISRNAVQNIKGTQDTQDDLITSSNNLNVSSLANCYSYSYSYRQPNKNENTEEPVPRTPHSKEDEEEDDGDSFCNDSSCERSAHPHAHSHAHGHNNNNNVTQQVKPAKDLVDQLHNDDIPLEITTSPKTNKRETRRSAMTRQKSQPLLLPRQRSFKDLKASKHKAKTRPVLAKQGSFTTRQAEFAALEAIMGKTRLPNNTSTCTTASTGRRTKLRRSQSLEGSGFTPSSPSTTSKSTMDTTKSTMDTSKFERRPIGLVSPAAAVARNGFLRNSGGAASSSAQRRRMMMLANSGKKTKRAQSMRHLNSKPSSSANSSSNSNRDELATTRHNSSSTEHNPRRASSMDKRGHMLRQGSFVAGSRMRTLRA
ncbi:expressed unknown protein [Seminavis robusta]|uniref:Uncharacterized protein n=1 Tax=Seminavis robusta TaxID=568900 RepID=A0A9N8D8Q0_9STRA|nr:expressed unknown protein [Seminavis robusta]|eukprot:Sro3_g002060.1 n/a (655) ;mRNA; f:38511-40475